MSTLGHPEMLGLREQTTQSTTHGLETTMTALSPHLRQATPVVAARGEGVHLYGEDGRRYLDFTAGIGVTSTGHCHPRVVAAAQEQVGTLIHGQYTTVMHRDRKSTRQNSSHNTLSRMPSSA